MCIAIYKDAESAPVKRKVLKTCFDNNGDGAGYAYWDRKKKTWVAQKGFMTFTAFWKSFNAHGFQKKDSYICHFRIGTSGNKRGPDCTHPFPVHADCEIMRKTEFETKNLVVHNGVHGPGDGTISDTMLAVRDWVYPLFPLMSDETRSERIMDIMCEGLKMRNNRWLVTEGYEVTLIGDWKTDDETGLRFSNDGWKRERIATVNPRYPAHGVHTRMNNGTSTTSASESVPTGDGIIRCWSGDHKTKYLDERGNFKWIEWTDDYEHHMENMQLVTGGVAPNEGEKDPADGMVSPHLSCAYKEEPVTVMGTIDSNGDCVWESSYDPAEDLLICPHCKEDKHLIDPKDHYNNPDAKAKLGDTICTRCGCIFMDEDGAIVGYDFALRKEYQKNVESN